MTELWLGMKVALGAWVAWMLAPIIVVVVAFACVMAGVFCLVYVEHWLMKARKWWRK